MSICTTLCLTGALHLLLLHLSFDRRGRWGTIDNFTTSFLHFSPFSTTPRDLSKSRPVHSLILSCHIFFSVCLVVVSSSLCLATTASPKLSFRASWRVGDAVVGRGNAGWTTAMNGHTCPCQNCSQGPPGEETGRRSLSES